MRWPWNKKDVKDSTEGDEIKPRNQILTLPDDVNSKSKEKLTEDENLSDRERLLKRLKCDVPQNDGKAKLERKNVSNTGDSDEYRSGREIDNGIPQTGKKVTKETMDGQIR